MHDIIRLFERLLIRWFKDVDGKEIIDFAISMGTVNLGHCNPTITEAVIKSISSCMRSCNLLKCLGDGISDLLTAFQTNIAVSDSQWPILAKTLCQKLGYDKVASMVSGAEGADAAVKIARKWGISRKGIAPSDLLILGCSENYHGLSSGIWPLMTPGCGQQGSSILLSNYLFFSKLTPE